MARQAQTARGNGNRIESGAITANPFLAVNSAMIILGLFSMRERNTNVIDTPAEAAQIAAAVATALQRGRGACDNVWGDGKAGERIAGLLASLPTGGAVLEKVNTY